MQCNLTYSLHAWYIHQSFSFPDEKCQGLDLPLTFDISQPVPDEASSLYLKKKPKSEIKAVDQL